MSSSMIHVHATKHSVVIRGLLAAVLVGVITQLAIPLAHATPPDTIYVDNTRTSPGGPFGKTIGNAFSSISTALDSVVGRNKVIAVMGTGTPYRERVTIAAIDSGTVGEPLVIFARGDVTIDGSDAVSGWVARWASASSTLKLWAAKVQATETTVNQVVVGDERYPEPSGDQVISDLPNVLAHQCYYVASADSVYVNFGAGDYTSTPGHISVLQPIKVVASFVVINGFTILRSRACGILIDGETAGIQRVPAVINTTVSLCGGDGIEARNSICGIITNCTLSKNSGHGLVLQSNNVETYTITGNSAYLNANPLGQVSKNGIRIGISSPPTDTARTGDHLIANNRVYQNNDSGIEVHGSNYNLLRYNISYNNGNHGFDHLYSRGTKHVGDLAYANYTDGISVEANCTGTSLYNCIMADNGRNTGNEDPELEVDPSGQWGLVADHNVYYRPGRTGADAGDLFLVDFQGNNQPNNEFCDDTTKCYKNLVAFRNFTNHEDNGIENNPNFVNASTADFHPQSSSPGIDEANSSATGWLETDVRGFHRHDYAGKVNGGTGTRSYDDIGPYEYDAVPGEITAVDVGYGKTTLAVSWIHQGDDGDVGTAATVDIDVNGTVRTVDALAAYNGQCEYFNVSACASYDVQLTLHEDDNGQSSQSDNYYASTFCTGNFIAECGLALLGGEESSAKRVEALVDYPLALSTPWPNPVREGGTFSYAIPRALGKVPYSMTLYDIAGRKALLVAAGSAKAGKHTLHVPFVTEGGAALSNGVYFLRLQIGGEVINRTVILAR